MTPDVTVVGSVLACSTSSHSRGWYHDLNLGKLNAAQINLKLHPTRTAKQATPDTITERNTYTAMCGGFAELQYSA